MSLDDRLFLSVPLDSSEPNACSPADPGPNWRGILIQAPRVISLPRTTPATGSKPLAPICGLYTLDVTGLMNGVPMLIRAVEQSTAKTYTGVVLDADPSPEAPPPDVAPIDPALLKGLANSSYFTRNLFNFVALPLRAARYEVHVEFGGLHSNKVLIEVRDLR